MNLNDISCPAVWHLRTQNGTQKQRLFARVLEFSKNEAYLYRKI